MKPAVLYISYDGMLEPLGQSQVLSYLERLTDSFEIHILSFEKKADWWRREDRLIVERRIEEAGLHWHPKMYHKRPTVPATAFDLSVGVAAAVKIVWRHRIRFLHARSYVPALIALWTRHITGKPYLFDMRGLWADERVDGELWAENGRLYRIAKRIERNLLLGAAHCVTLTRASLPVLKSLRCAGGKLPPFDIIPTCADLDRFAPQSRVRPDGFTLGYVGSIGTWYLFDEILDCFKRIAERESSTKLLIVNRSEHELVRRMLVRAGIDQARVELNAAAHYDVPQLIARMSVGAAIIKPAYSKIASAPTKVAEYLGCGIPCLGNKGVGDMEEILEDERTGVALNDMSSEAKTAGIERLFELMKDPGLADRCREVAQRRFSIETGVAAYRRIYERLAG